MMERGIQYYEWDMIEESILEFNNVTHALGSQSKKLDYSKIKLLSNTRSAIKIWVQENLNLQDRIYIPSYICSDLTIPLTEMGQSITYYPCKANLEPDWEWLENNITNDGKALLLVHYFGFPNNIEHAVKFANHHQIILLEDCAHSFLTRVQLSLIHI